MGVRGGPKKLKFLMGPGWAKKVEILDGSGWAKKVEIFDGSGVGKKVEIFDGSGKKFFDGQKKLKFLMGPGVGQKS